MSTTVQGSGSEGVVGEAKAGLAEAAEVVQEKAVELKEEGRGKLGDVIDQRTTQVGEQARGMAQILRQGGEQAAARTDGSGEQVAQVARFAADRAERLGGYLEQASGDRLLRDAEEFARRRPWMVAGLGLVAGLAASRFLKASSERRYRSGSSATTMPMYSTGGPASGSAQLPAGANVG